MAALLSTGSAACGTLGLRTEPPLPVVVQAPPPVVPAECRLGPVERRAVDEPVLAPEAGPPEVLARNALANARLAFTYWRERATVAEEQADINAGTQRACASWARRQEQ